MLIYNLLNSSWHKKILKKILSVFVYFSLKCMYHLMLFIRIEKIITYKVLRTQIIKTNFLKLCEF